MTVAAPFLQAAYALGSMTTDSFVALTFRKHARKWKRETAYVSSLTDKYLHPSYARIIGLGPSAVPLILETLKRDPGDWFFALRALTGVNPVPNADAGDMPRMAAAWIKWGRQRHLIG